MKDQDKTPEELLEELHALRRRLTEMEAQRERNQLVEAALAESEARYRLLAESTDDIIAVLDPSGRLRYANRAAAEQIGATKAKKHSGNSSKPPSGDIVKPKAKQKKPGRPRKRKIGGQPGHERHTQKPFEPDELDQEWTLAFIFRRLVQSERHQDDPRPRRHRGVGRRAHL